MQRYLVTLTGTTPLLTHKDHIEWAEYMDKWRLDPANKKLSVPGDDRTPAWRWIGHAYIEGGKVVIPSDNLMTTMREGGSKIQTGKGMETYKRLTQSGIVVDQIAWPLLVNGNEIPYQPIKDLIDNNDFEYHQKVAESLGFELFVKRAKIGAAKHIRVRPRFEGWSTSGTMTVLDDSIKTDTLRTILTFAGIYCGIGDWRPSSPKSPGSFGKFTVSLKEI
jgi:hypothetical protein